MGLNSLSLQFSDSDLEWVLETTVFHISRLSQQFTLRTAINGGGVISGFGEILVQNWPFWSINQRIKRK